MNMILVNCYNDFMYLYIIYILMFFFVYNKYFFIIGIEEF